MEQKGLGDNRGRRLETTLRVLMSSGSGQRIDSSVAERYDPETVEAAPWKGIIIDTSRSIVGKAVANGHRVKFAPAVFGRGIQSAFGVSVVDQLLEISESCQKQILDESSKHGCLDLPESFKFFLRCST